jgi:lauroyl/myristoyl acyltransferase
MREASRLPLAAARDLRALALWWFGYGVTAVLPRRARDGFLRALAWVDQGRDRRKGPLLQSRIAAVLAPYQPRADFAAVARSYYELKREERLGLWWSLHRRPSTIALDVAGRHHLAAALEAGRGAILWGMSFGGAWAPKSALHQVGVPLVHLSGETHGAPEPVTRLGLRRVAPFQVRAESPYLADRVVIGPSSMIAGLRRLGPHLRANRCVWIGGEGEVGRTAVPASLLGLERRFPTGAPSLALHSGSPLLPVRIQRLGPWSYRLVFEQPIDLEPASRRQAWAAEAIRRFALSIERAVLDHPADWNWSAVWLLDALRRRGIDPGPPARLV